MDDKHFASYLYLLYSSKAETMRWKGKRKSSTYIGYWIIAIVRYMYGLVAHTHIVLTVMANSYNCTICMHVPGSTATSQTTTLPPPLQITSLDLPCYLACLPMYLGGSLAHETTVKMYFIWHSYNNIRASYSNLLHLLVCWQLPSTPICKHTW